MLSHSHNMRVGTRVFHLTLPSTAQRVGRRPHVPTSTQAKCLWQHARGYSQWSVTPIIPPPKAEYKNAPLTVVLDIDEMMIHSTQSKMREEVMEMMDIYEYHTERPRVLKRLKADAFLHDVIQFQNTTQWKSLDKLGIHTVKDARSLSLSSWIDVANRMREDLLCLDHKHLVMAPAVSDVENRIELYRYKHQTTPLWEEVHHWLRPPSGPVFLPGAPLEEWVDFDVFPKKYPVYQAAQFAVTDVISNVHRSKVKRRMRPDYRIGHYMVGWYRNHLAEFLQTLVDLNVEVLVFTAGMKVYADEIMRLLPNKFGSHIQARVYREDVDGSFKNLLKLGRDMSRLVLIDNSEWAIGHQHGNSIHVDEFYGQTYEAEHVARKEDDDYLLRDTELLRVTDVIKKLVNVDGDIRPHLMELHRERTQDLLNNPSRLARIGFNEAHVLER
eukprot:GFYU01012405.1.p1 GENE.GFYU01012405.1~~GFYU01012405.1.p1  ORF type:complete len:441 (+),score=72.47 GFYU01012405.1:24-1346(+)